MKTWLIMAIALFQNAAVFGQTNSTDYKSRVKAFVSNYHTFKMDIQAAGIAIIPFASFSEEKELYIEYFYQSGNEKRNGKMTLTSNDKNRFEGHWKTISDNGNVYQGALYFVFKKNGEANGQYIFMGSNYKITIFTPSK